MNKPNILYIHSHDTGRYIQPYGHAVPTSNIQELAEEGVMFRQAYCSSPTCSPSRASMLTGQYPHNNGMLGLSHKGFRLNDYRHHIVHTLRAAGYVSALAGVQHIADTFDIPWKTIGYDMYLGEPPLINAGSHIPPNNAHLAAVEFLDNTPQQPFFLSIGFVETHRQFPPLPPNRNPGYTLPPALLPDTPQIREDMARYKTSAKILDDKIGAVCRALERNGLAENTLVICTTDHGIAFPQMKCNLSGSGIGVMLIIRGPGGFSGGKVSDSLVSQIDIFPTICDFIGIPEPDWLQGKSLMPTIRGTVEEIRHEVYAEINYHVAYEPVRSVRTRRWSYIRRFDRHPHPILPNTDGSPSKDFLLAHDWGNTPLPEEALYNLIHDPNETHNLMGEPGMEGVIADMRQRLENWMRETQDPLLIHGYVPLPPGAFASDSEGASPS